MRTRMNGAMVAGLGALLLAGCGGGKNGGENGAGDNSDAAIKQTRETTEKTMAAFSDKKIEDVPGLGKAAFFVPGINQLNVFLDDSRFVILTIGSAPNATAKDTAVGLMGKMKR